MTCSVDDLWSTFKQRAITCIEKYIRHKFAKERNGKPWVTKPLQRLIAKRNKHYSKYRATGSRYHKDKYKQTQARVQNGIRSSYWALWTFGQRHRRALVHLEEFDSAESAERALSGYDENVEALPYRCRPMWLRGETYYVSSYDMWWCPQLHVDWPSFSNHCRCQLCQTLGGINLTVDIEESTKKRFRTDVVAFSPQAMTKPL